MLYSRVAFASGGFFVFFVFFLASFFLLFVSFVFSPPFAGVCACLVTPAARGLHYVLVLTD